MIRTVRLFILVFFSFYLFAVKSNAEERGEDSPRELFNQLQIACREDGTRDKVCDFLVGVRDLENDALEAVKEYANLTPAQYFALTIANAAASGRIRFRSRVPYYRYWEYAVDLRRDGWFVDLQRTF